MLSLVPLIHLPRVALMENDALRTTTIILVVVMMLPQTCVKHVLKVEILATAATLKHVVMES